MKKNIYKIILLVLLESTGFAEETVSLRVSKGLAEVQFKSIRDKQYTVEFSEDLKSWIAVDEEIFGTGASVVSTHSLEGISTGFYRTKRSDRFSFSFDPACFKLGSQWNYSVREEDPEGIVSYTQVQKAERYSTKNGHAVLEIDAYKNGHQWSGTQYFLRDMSEGMFLAGGNDPVDGEVVYNQPEPASFNEFVPGVQGPGMVVPSPKPGLSQAILHEKVSIDYGTVVVPAGSFQNTVKVETQMTGTYSEGGYTMPYTFLETTWYDRGVGEVKTTFSIKFEIEGFDLSVTSVKQLTFCSLI